MEALWPVPSLEGYGGLLSIICSEQLPFLNVFFYYLFFLKTAKKKKGVILTKATPHGASILTYSVLMCSEM